MTDLEATKRTPEGDRDTIVEKGEEPMDAELWGKLQDHIPLDVVYEKLPLQDRLALRVVCKSWYRSTLQRLEPKPYFVNIAVGYSKGPDVVYRSGVLKYDVASGEFSFEHHPFRLYRAYSPKPEFYRVLPLEVEGRIIYGLPHNYMEEHAVYNVHIKTWHVVPPAPESIQFHSMCGMMVDTSESPYTFKLVLGSVHRKTQIYDSKSRSWSTTSSVMLSSAIDPLNQCVTYSCMCHNGCVYLSMGKSSEQMILVYSLQEDSWTTLNFPSTCKRDHNTLGVWEGRIFTTREDLTHNNIVVWVLVDPNKQEWVEYARCSEDEYYQLLSHDDEEHGYEGMRLVTVFSAEYMLIYNWHNRKNRADALLMFNVKSKKWIPVGLPKGTVSTRVVGDDESTGEEMDVHYMEVEDDESVSCRRFGYGFRGFRWNRKTDHS